MNFSTINIVILLQFIICSLIYNVFNYNLEHISCLERQINTTSRGNSMYYTQNNWFNISFILEFKNMYFYIYKFCR